MLKNWFRPPVFADEEATRKARSFHSIAWGVIGVVVCLMPVIALLQPEALGRAFANLGTVTLLGLILLDVNRRGYTRLASVVLIAGVIARVSWNAIDQGGIHSPGIGVFLVFVLMAGLLMGEREGIIAAGLCALISLSFALAEVSGLLPPTAIRYGPLALWTLQSLYMGLVIVLTRMAAGNIKDALLRSREELAERKKAEVRLALAVGAGEIGVWEFDVRKNSFIGSDRAFILLGLPLPPDRVISMEDWKARLHPEDAMEAIGTLQKVITGAGTEHTSYRTVLPDGRVRFNEASGTAVLDDAGRAVGAVGTVMDVTERRTAEQARERLLHDYGERIKELTAIRKASALFLDTSLDIPSLLKALVELIPPAFQYPGITQARLRYGTHSAATAGFRTVPWHLRKEFSTRDRVNGSLEVVYLEARPAEAEGPFLKEERTLLETLAEMISTSMERLRSEEQLQAQGRRFQAMVENIGDGIALVDAAGVVMYDSDSTGRVLGYKDGDFVGATMQSSAHPDDLPALMTNVEKAHAEPGMLVLMPATRFRHKKGHWVWTEGSFRNRFDDPTIAALVVSYRDVTPRIEAQKALMKSEAGYRNIIETSGEAIIAVDKDTNITLANPKLCALLGYSAAELVGLKTSKDILFPEDDAMIRERREKRKQTDQSQQFELRLRKKDGNPVPVLVSATATRDEYDRYAGTIAMMTDMTDQRRLQADLLQSQKIEAMGRLSGGIAHDFNNLLTAILGFSHLVNASFEASDPRREDVDQIISTAKRAAELTRQLLAFSRKQVMEPVVLSVNDVVKDMGKMLGRLIGEDIKLETALDPALASCRADKGQAEQVLLNLVVNARDAMKKGGKITVATSNAVLDAEAAQALGVPPGPFVCLTVSDTGHGMTEEIQRRIFEPFFTTKAQGVGTGLGLATVHGIVKQSAGCLRVRSAPGAGANFDVFLPAVAGQKPEAPKAAPAGNAGKGRETILLVDDDGAIRTSTRRLLGAAGYLVLEAAGGREALEILKKEGDRLALLITDVVMPEMGGFELAQEAQRLRPGLRVLCVSGYLDRERPDELPGLKVSYLQKPFSAEDLTAKVRALLDAPA